MNRKDTIIIAVLLNATLLAILFVTASHNSEEIDQSSNFTFVETNPTNSSTQEILLAANTTVAPVDEIDSALKKFSGDPELILVDETENFDKEPVPPPVTPIPPQNPPKDPVEQGNEVKITVKKGDALEKIARSNNTTVEAIKKLNDLKSNKLSIGQQLKIPVGSKKNTPSKEVKNQVVSNKEEFYVIKNGDNPWKIAKQFNVRFDDLLKLNNLDEEKARNLKIGDRIRVK